MWKIVSSLDGSEYAWAAIAWAVDSVQKGPDRRLKKRETPPVAYSGDDWHGDFTKAATLTFADGTTKTAIITIEKTGFVIIVR